MSVPVNQCNPTGTRQGLQNEGAGNALLQVRASSTNVNAKAVVVVVAMVVMMMVMITKIRPGHDGVIAMMMVVMVMVIVKLRHLQRLLLSRGLRVISLERI